MKKLLYQFDTDPLASVFDNVVAHDGGADVVVPYAGITPANVGGLVDGAIFTRAPKDKKLTAIFVGGSDMLAGEALFKAVKKKFFANFRVSVMLDSNGSNTTAAAGVAWLHHAAVIHKGGHLAGKRAVILAGTGPVGQRAAVMLAREGVQVAITGRSKDKAQAAAKAIAERFKVEVEAIEAADNAARVKAIAGAQIVFASGAAGVQLLDEASWRDHKTLELLADANATPPLGIEGIEMLDKMKERHGKLVFGALGFGALKIALHRACIGRLFEQQDLSLDCDEIYAIAKEMVART